MQIQILSVQIVGAFTKANKPYEKLDLAYKNLTFQGKVEGKNLMPFGANAAAFKTLRDAPPGSVFDITVQKNDQGYNDWLAATPASADPASSYSAPPAAPSRGNTSNTAPTAARTSTYETPEERAAKQVYIVRQSSLSTAVAALSVGSKSALKADDVIAFANQLADYVLGHDKSPASSADTGFDDMSDDVPL